MQFSTPLNRMKSSFIREILAAASDPDVISLAGGLPDEKTFPIELLKPTIAALADDSSLFQYGSTQGYLPLIKHLGNVYELLATHKLMITTGSQQGLDLIARAFINPGDGVAMEAPSYLGAMQVFNFVQANIWSIAQQKNGPDLAALEHCFATQKPKIFYAVPDFHNPTGVSWSLSTRQAVAKLCQQYQVMLLEDAPYRDLRFAGEMLPLVSSFCPDLSLVLHSFSKIASPGLRVGVASGPAQWVDALIKVKQGADLHSNVPAQAMLLGLLQHPEFNQHIGTICSLYRDRYQVLFEALQSLKPLGCDVAPIDGGMFVWLTLPECDSYALAKTLLEQGVATVPSDVFFSGEKLSSALRLNFTNAGKEQLKRAVNRIHMTLSQAFEFNAESI